LILQGRALGAAELQQVQQLVAAHPALSRYQLSRSLAQEWDWRTPTGQLKDMAARSLLLKLEARGLVRLPPRRRPSPNRMRHKQVLCLAHATAPRVAALAAVRPLAVREVSREPAALQEFESLLHQYHYLSYTSTVGMNLKYLAWDREGRPLGCALFGSAAWQCAARDRFLGWDAPTRQRGLSRLTNNTRFLILPWVTVPHLASHLLGHITRRLRADWQGKYGQPLSAVETFVETARFRATCYRAANWLYVGQTTGRSRQDHQHQLAVPPKAVYCYPLVESFRQELGIGP